MKALVYLYNNFIFFIARIRANFWSFFGRVKTGKNVYLFGGVIIIAPSGVRIGNRVTVNTRSRLDGSGQLEIGDDVMIGPGVQIITSNHRFDRLDIPMMYQGINKKPVLIKDDVWIGSNSIILPGVTIGTGAIVSAGAVVTKNIMDFDIVAGVPSKVIKSRLPKNTA